MARPSRSQSDPVSRSRTVPASRVKLSSRPWIRRSKTVGALAHHASRQVAAFGSSARVSPFLFHRPLIRARSGMRCRRSLVSNHCFPASMSMSRRHPPMAQFTTAAATTCLSQDRAGCGILSNRPFMAGTRHRCRRVGLWHHKRRSGSLPLEARSTAHVER